MGSHSYYPPNLPYSPTVHVVGLPFLVAFEGMARKLFFWPMKCDWKQYVAFLGEHFKKPVCNLSFILVIRGANVQMKSVSMGI